MRTNIIQPYIKTKKDGSKEQIGYIASHQKWHSSNHCAIELCETAVRRREQILSKLDGQISKLGTTYQIHYQNCCASAEQ